MAEITPAGVASVHVQLERDEGQLLKQLLDEMRTLLNADIPRNDPVVKRLFPDAHEDEAQEQAYRELVDDQLRAAKLSSLVTIEEGLSEATRGMLSLSAEEVDAWLATLTDMRLAIGTRLDVNEETMAADIDRHDPDAPAFGVMHWLGWMQEMMVRALGDSMEGNDPR